MYCVECGTRFARTEAACPACGLALEEMFDERPRHRPRTRVLPPYNGMLPVIGTILVVAGIALFIAAPILDEVFRRSRFMRELSVFLACLAGGLAELTALIVFMMWLYQAWRLVARPDEDFSPGLKVGLLFVPFFNFYWMFQVIPGLSSVIQEELRYLAPARSHQTGFVPGLLACVFLLIPYFQPVAMCMFVAWALLANNSIQRLIRYNDWLRDEQVGAPQSGLV